MQVYTPTKKSLPSWMMMNEQTSQHWMNSLGVDMEITGKDLGFSQADIDDGISQRESAKLQHMCNEDHPWSLARMTNQKVSRACDSAAMKYPEFVIRHAACHRAMTNVMNIGVPSTHAGKNDFSCSMYSPISGKMYPEYAKCLKSDAVDNVDCRRTCYVYPNQKGCELIVAGLSAEERASKLRELSASMSPDDVPQPMKPGDDPPQPKPEPVPEPTVIIAASMRSVSPTAVQFAYVDPKTKKAVVVKKTLVDMYKPTDRVTVVLDKKTNKFVGLRKK